MADTRNSGGFTIVELLIAIVVIGILAAITIDLSGASRLMAAYEAENGRYPATLAEANNGSGVRASSGTSYQYAIPSGGATYCLTATKSTASYKVSNTSMTPTQGGCASHGIGGVATITNRVLNPSFENGTAANGGNISASGGNRTILSTGALQGSQHMRATFSVATALGWGQFTDNLALGTYTASFYVRSNINGGFQPYFEGSSVRSTISQSGALTLTPNTWQRGWVTFNVTTTGTVNVGGYFSNTGTTPTVGIDYVDFDAFILTEGSTVHNYADGLTNNWIGMVPRVPRHQQDLLFNPRRQCKG